jgi:hypothetical protein
MPGWTSETPARNPLLARCFHASTLLEVFNEGCCALL